MPLENALVPDSTPIEGDLSIGQDLNYDSSQPDAQPVADYTSHDPSHPEYMQPTDATPPSPKEAKFVKYDDDGSAVFSNGVKYLPNGSIRWEDKDTGTIFEQKNPYVKAVTIGKKKDSPSDEADKLMRDTAARSGISPSQFPLGEKDPAYLKAAQDVLMRGGHPKHQLADFTGPDGKTYKALVDTDTGDIVKKYDDPSSRANAQAEMLRVRMLNSAKTQPGIVAYVNVKNNYDSLLQNAEIPDKQRTAADDAAAIQAFGAIEHPGTGVTDSDKRQAAALVPLWSSIGLKIKNFASNKSNTLTGDTVRQMRDAAKRALDGRQKTYNDELAPFIKEAQRLGLAPEEVNGALGANVVDPQAKPTGTSNQPTSTYATPAASTTQYPIGTKARKRDVWHTMTDHGWEPPL